MAKDIISARLHVMNYLIWVVIIVYITPYKYVPWVSYVIASFFSMFVATIAYCLITWMISRLVTRDKIGVSIGVVPVARIYDFKSVEICYGYFPLPDVSLPASIIDRRFKTWCITTLPTLIMMGIGVALYFYRNSLGPASLKSVTPMGLPQAELAGMMTIACWVTAYITEIMYQEKWKQIYPRISFLYFFWEIVLIGLGCIFAYSYSDLILTFIKTGL